MMMRSEFCQPEVISSILGKPVESPLIPSVLLAAIWISSMAFLTSGRMGSKSPFFSSRDSSKRLASARCTCSLTATTSSKASLSVWEAMPMRLRLRALSARISACASRLEVESILVESPAMKACPPTSSSTSIRRSSSMTVSISMGFCSIASCVMAVYTSSWVCR